jgi:mannose-1-phosphate guanylyltransferase
LLLAAGLGTRLRPITDSIPKCLVPILGKPLLGYWLDLLCQGGIERILINVHYFPEQVERFAKDSVWRDRIELAYESDLLGTGGTVLRNRKWLENGPFILAHADNLTRFKVEDFVLRHETRPPGTEITMMTFETDAPQTCGIVEEDAAGVVVAFHEKVAHPPGNHANAAVYILEPGVIDFIASLGKDFVDLSTEVLPAYIGRMTTFHNSDYHRDIGNPESLALAHREFIA